MKTRILTFVVVSSNVLGNLSLSWGMRGTASLFRSPLAYLEVLSSPWVAMGVCLLVLWMLSQMALLSCADLSYALPLTSFGYVLSVAAGRLFLHEQISPVRWLGVLLIVAGVTLVSRTPARTTRG